MDFEQIIEALRCLQGNRGEVEHCGCVIRTEDGFAILRGRNVHPQPELGFEIDRLTMLKAWKSRAFAYVYHTHVGHSAKASEADRRACNAIGVPFLILAAGGAIDLIYPESHCSILVGKGWELGVTDCVSLVEAYYRELLAIELPPHEVPEPWPPDHDYFAAQAASWGFRPIFPEPPQPHDVLAFKIASRFPVHLAVYLGDGRIVHHPRAQLSQVSELRPRWARHWVNTYRYGDERR